MAAAPQRVLLYRLGSLGDHLVALPSYRLVARAFPHAERRLVTNVPVASKAAAAEAVLDGSGLVQGYFRYVVGERGPWALIRLLWAIRRWRPEVLVYLAGARGLEAARRDAWFFRLCGVRRIVGLPDSEDLQRNCSLGERNGVPWWEHEGERLLRCVAALGDGRAGDPASWRLGLTAAERAQVELADVPFFAFSLGTKAQANQWGLDRWIELFERLGTAWPGCGLVALGAPEEALESELVLAAWGAAAEAGPTLNLCGKTTPRVSAAVLERARLFLGHDSGPAHLAASVGTAVVGVYSSRMPAGQWIPHGEHVSVVLHWPECGGCLLQECVVEGKKCIESIGVDEVFGVVERRLRGEGVDAVSCYQPPVSPLIAVKLR